jgi:hypothetical protein
MLTHCGTYQGRELLSLFVGSLDEIPQQLTLPSRYFTCLFACGEDALSEEGILKAANTLLDAGLVYLSAWGPFSGWVHVMFDLAIVRREIAQFPDGLIPSNNPLIPTSDHEQESLDKALWFALSLAFPDDAYFEEWNTMVAITVGNREWAKQIEQRLSNPDQLIADVVGD